MTWPEVKQALADGRNTALIMNGGTEERGPQGVNGAQSLIGRKQGVEIAQRPGKAILAPVIPYSPNPASAALPGTIGISTEVFEKLNEEIAEQMITNGFKNIVPVGDHGGDNGWVRRDLIATALGDPVRKRGEAQGPNAKRVDNGIEGDARRSTPEIGKKVAEMKVDYAVAAIQRLLK